MFQRIKRYFENNEQKYYRLARIVAPPITEAERAELREAAVAFTAFAQTLNNVAAYNYEHKDRWHVSGLCENVQHQFKEAVKILDKNDNYHELCLTDHYAP